MAPPLRSHHLDLLLDENSSTFEGGAKIVPQVELSFAPSNGSRDGAILAPHFSAYTQSQKKRTVESCVSLHTGRDNKILNLLSYMFLYGKVLYLLFAKSIF